METKIPLFACVSAENIKYVAVKPRIYGNLCFSVNFDSQTESFVGTFSIVSPNRLIGHLFAFPPFTIDEKMVPSIIEAMVQDPSLPGIVNYERTSKVQSNLLNGKFLREFANRLEDAIATSIYTVTITHISSMVILSVVLLNDQKIVLEIESQKGQVARTFSF